MPTPLTVAGVLWLVWGGYWLFAARSVKRDERAEPLLLRAIHLGLIGAAFALAFSLVPLPRPLRSAFLDAPWTWAGAALTAAALAFAIWARVHLGAYWSGRITVKEGHQLIRTGPYAIVRHPIYTGFAFGFAGAAIASGRLAALLGLSLVIVAYAIKIPREEKVLAAQLSEYADYRRQVRALVPFVL